MSKEPDVMFGARESVAEAARVGISSVIVSVDEQIPKLLDRLESEGLKYELIDLAQVQDVYLGSSSANGLGTFFSAKWQSTLRRIP